MNRIFHNPPHIYVDNAIYIVTSSTYSSIPYFMTDEKKSILQERIFYAIHKTNSTLHAWVILNNHYHLLLKIREGRLLGRTIKLINGSSARAINDMDNIKGRKIWYNYWDACMRNEKEFYTRLNYIHQNPIKHGYIKNLSDLDQYHFSSYSTLLKEKGREWMLDSFNKYPIKDFTEKGEP